MESHSAQRTHEYQPTIIETRFLIERLLLQIALRRDELKLNWTQFKRNPIGFLACLIRELLAQLKKFLTAPYALRASSTAISAVVCVVVIVLVVERSGLKPGQETDGSDQAQLEVTLLDVKKPDDPEAKPGMGKNGSGRVGFQNNNGEGSGPKPQRAQGGGSGGDGNPLPVHVGKIPLPSAIQAPIPIGPPINPPALPAAGIDIDPALWQDLKAPVYGDPLAKAETRSKGPGTDGGMGTNEGLGIGNGRGPGYGNGNDGNTGDGNKQPGCCNPGGSRGEGGTERDGPPLRGSEVEQRARLLSKPEPQYTEEARTNQIQGTVVLRVVFASSGDVVQIRAVRTLPFGLTERAIAAARQIRFSPAMKGGHPVSVFMQLEYNFNLY